MSEGVSTREHAGTRARAQEIVQQHVNKKRGNASKIDWNYIHVLWVSHAQGNQNWEAIVRVEGKADKLYYVHYHFDSDDMIVDTYSRKHVSRYY